VFANVLAGAGAKPDGGGKRKAADAHEKDVLLLPVK
jgi:hypothetical protein